MAYTVFIGAKWLGEGTLPVAYNHASANPGSLIYDSETGKVVDIDPNHPPEPEAKGPGRPKLGVTAREVTLLPRHWEWLARQPGGASVALRKLVEAASRDPKAARLEVRDAVCRLATALAGNEAGFEEAMRALYAGKRKRFRRQIETWPPDVRDYLEKLAAPVFNDDED